MTEDARLHAVDADPAVDPAVDPASHRPAGRLSDAEGEPVAELDFDRADRRGYPEAIYCEGKSVEQVRAIARAVRGRPDLTHLFTRADAERRAAIAAELPDAFVDEVARLVVWPAARPEASGELVVIACAGTSDLPVAREALLTARHLGRRAELVTDVGIAGVHRTLRRLETFQRAGVVVVVAGMDGALPGLIAGLISAPVVAVPTSVGYGAAFGGLAPLLTMLNACAPGVAVVNIDNGYGAGHLAAQIAAPRPSKRAGDAGEPGEASPQPRESAHEAGDGRPANTTS